MVCIFESLRRADPIPRRFVLTIVDRVFVKAITTIRALSSRSNYGSLPRPPAENRIKLYGLYKQATEGNVDGVMPRPIGFTLEDEGAKKKWDAWKREEGLSKTEAKRRYISYLIDTMKVYASGTLEARELLGELEYLWDQIKDLQFTPDEELEHHPQIPLPSHSPLFSQAPSDRYSTTTPLPLPSNYSASVSNQQYRNNLQKIYSHSRRSTMLSINDYVQQQRQQLQPQGGSQPNVAHSVYSLPGVDNQKVNVQPHHSIATNNQSVNLDDFKTWQGEINLIINKLSREFLNKKPNSSMSKGLGRHHRSPSEPESEPELDYKVRLKLRTIQILKLVGNQLLKFSKNFSISVLAMLFIVWCIKKNVVIKQTMVKQPVNNLRHQKKELVINMILSTNENKWFIRLLNIINSFVGFV